jgi:hypothetical protein
VHEVLGQRLEARVVLVVLSATDERGRLIVVAAAIGWGRHILLLVLVLRVRGVTSHAVEVSLDVFCAPRD